MLAAVLAAALFPSAAPAQVSGPAYFDFIMARRLEGAGKGSEALAALNRAAAADKGSAEIRAAIAGFYMRHDQHDEAVKAGKDALALDADNLEAHRILGLIAASDADEAFDARNVQAGIAASRDAITHLEKVAGDPSADINLHYTLGRLYLRTGQPQKAVQSLGRVLTQNPGSLQARLYIAQAYALSEDLKSAIETLQEIVPDEPRLAAALAQYQEQAGQFKEAADTYNLALEVSPGSRELKFRRATALFGARDYDGAAAAAAQAQRQHPEDARFPKLQARALAATGNAGRAAAVLEDAIKAFPEDTQMRFTLADLYSNAKRPQEAEKTIRDLLATDGDNADAMNYLGYMLADRGEKLDEAIRLVRRALESEPDNPSYLDSLGWAYYRKGEYADAEKYLTPAATKLPNNAVIQDHLGDLLARRSRWQDAINAWTKALGAPDAGDLDRDAVEKKIGDARRKVAR